LLLDRIVNVVDEGIDVAVRIAHLPDSALLAHAVGHVARIVVASPAYLARHGEPARPADLGAHRCIAFTGPGPAETWTFGTGSSRHVKVRPVLSVNTADAAIATAARGVGVTRVLSYQAAAALRSGELVRVLPSYEPAPLPVHLVTPAASAKTAKVRAFIELALPILRRAMTEAAVEPAKTRRAR
jgi:DNA-binding transcriptional LysR family regulator